MKKISKSLFVLTIASLVAGTAVSAASLPGKEVTFLAPIDGDLAATAVMAAPEGPTAMKSIDIPRQPVAVSWALPTDKALEVPAPFVARSREYFVDLEASELRSGVPVYTHGPGALVRLNPANAEAAGPIDPHAVVLQTADKRVFGEGAGMELIASAEQLQAAGSPFVAGTAAFRISTELGAGTLGLRVPDLPGEGRYVMHVLDAQSPVTLSLQTGQMSYHHGQELTVEASFDGGVIASVEGYVTSPSGRAWPIEWAAGEDGIFRASLVLDSLEAPQPGLWEAHASARGFADDTAVLRHARVAFDCGVATARLLGEAEIVTGGSGMSVALAVEAASSSRYEVRGVLMGTARGGVLVPVAIAHSAAWIEAGVGSLELAFEAEAIETSGVRGPFEVHDLQLVDQAAMKVLHRQARGLVIP